MIKRVVVPFSMEWMKRRLRELDKSGAAFARHLGIPKERVYEMWAGKRRLQQEEIGPAARFMELSEAELVARLEGRPLNETKKQTEQTATQQVAFAQQPFIDITLPPLVMYRTAHATGAVRGAFMLFSQKIDEVPRPFFLKFSTKAFSFRVLDDRMHPAYRRWDILLIDPDSPGIEGEDCLFTDRPEADSGSHSVIGRFKASTGTQWTVHQYGPKRDLDLSRAEFPNCWPIVGRYNRR
jgi:phage repressor protein C with HTH and peptisase S24 domain